MIYELRTYFAEPGKLPDLHRRMEEHALGYFERHGFHVVGMWTVVVGRNPRLIYLLAFRDFDHFQASWRAMRSDPDWLQAVKDSESAGSLTTRIDSELLESVPYFPSVGAISANASS